MLSTACKLLHYYYITSRTHRAHETAAAAASGAAAFAYVPGACVPSTCVVLAPHSFLTQLYPSIPLCFQGASVAVLGHVPGEAAGDI
jgi:hypothetical protein